MEARIPVFNGANILAELGENGFNGPHMRGHCSDLVLVNPTVQQELLYNITHDGTEG